MNREFIRNKKNKDHQNRKEYTEESNRRIRGHGMNLYEDQSESESEIYETEESEESQLADETKFKIKELSEKNESEERSIHEDLREILDDINSLSGKKQEQTTPLKNMKISHIPNLRTDLDSMNAGRQHLKSITKQRPFEKLETNLFPQSPKRRPSELKQALYYSNEKPGESKMFLRSTDNQREENWSGMGDINESGVLYADDMNPNLESRVSRFLEDLKGQEVGKQQAKRYLNVLLLGKAFRGKSDLLRQIFWDAFGRRVELRAEKVKKGNFEMISHEKRTRECVSNFTFTDSRGFLSGLAVDKWFENIKSHLHSNMAEHYKLQCAVDADPSLRFRKIADGRVHLSLYLLQFPRLSPNDYIYLKRLQSQSNVLPIVVIKAEDANKYSLSQIEAMKRQMHLDLVELNMDCVQWGRQDSLLHSLEKKLIAKCFPAVVQLRDLQPGAPKSRALNSDFHIVLKIMLNPYISLFQLRTEQMYTSKLPKLLKMKIKENEEEAKNDDSDDDQGGNDKIGFGAGVAVGLGLIGAFMAFKSKLF